MKTLNITSKLSCDELLKTVPKSDQFDQLIKEDTVVLLNGEPVALYLNTPKGLLTNMRKIAKTTKFAKSVRTWGLPTQSSVFGSLPRNPLRNDRCRYSKKTSEEKQNFVDAFAFGNYVGEVYKKYLPEAFKLNAEIIDASVEDSWRPTEMPFTTCNFNVNHAIKHHRDTGNFKGVFSNVLILKEGVSGGRLVFPELRIAFEQSDGALGIFDGQKWMHGVTPIFQTEPQGYRASIVFYALEGMKKCYPYKAELQRFSEIKTKRAIQRAKGNPVLKKMVKREA
jgi:hypothetical protein